LGKVDAVSIAVPTGEHHQVARDFLTAGVDVLVEKPICATLKEADDLIDLAGKKNLILQVDLSKDSIRQLWRSTKSLPAVFY